MWIKDRGDVEGNSTEVFYNRIRTTRDSQPPCFVSACKFKLSCILQWKLQNKSSKQEHIVSLQNICSKIILSMNTCKLVFYAEYQWRPLYLYTHCWTLLCTKHKKTSFSKLCSGVLTKVIDSDSGQKFSLLQFKFWRFVKSVDF